MSKNQKLRPNKRSKIIGAVLIINVVALIIVSIIAYIVY